MPVSLLDVNVLVALFSQDSSHHAAAQHWFSRNAGAGWATCPFTQAGFVRVVSNPAAFPNPSPPEQAIDLLAENMQHPAHVFWTDVLTMVEAAAAFRPFLRGHQQVTDAYLLGLALKRKGRLATFDKAVLALASAAGMENLVALVPPVPLNR